MDRPINRIASIGECMVEIGMPGPSRPAGHVDFAGDTFNTAVYLKRCQPEAEVAYVTALGTDAVSNRLMDRFAHEGLTKSLVERRDDRVPGAYAISVDAAGERTFTYWRDQSAARTLFEAPARISVEDLTGFDMIYLSGISLAILSDPVRQMLLESLRRFRHGGGLVAFDSNYRPCLWNSVSQAQRTIGAFWAVTDIGLPSLDDEQALFGDQESQAVLSRLADIGVRRGALKCGAAGPVPLDPAGPLPVFRQNTRVIDTTAAGDSLNGAYLAAVAQSRPVTDCLFTGHDMAMEVIAFPGAIIPRQAPNRLR